MTDPKKLFTAKIGKACIDLHARKSTPSHTESVIMAAVVEYEKSVLTAFPALPPLKWEKTWRHQCVMCPLTHDSYTLMGTDDGWHCEFIPAKGITRHQLKENVERPVAIAAIEEHRNSKLKENLQ